MSWIFVDKEKDGSQGQMRSGDMYMRGDEYEHGYRMGYKHGWEDSDEEDMEYRRSRDSRGRYM